MAPLASRVMAQGTPAATPSGGQQRTIEHKYGETEISGFPQRVVTLGLTDLDPMLALGVVPVGSYKWYPDYPTTFWPWAQDELGDAEPPVGLVDAEFDFEQILALEPDLITAVHSGITQDDYDTLSQIAPTVAQSGEFDDYGTPWQQMTQTIGRALGREPEAVELINGVETQFETAREAHPELQGATAVVAAVYNNGTYAVYGPGDPRGQILTSLGFTYPESVASVVEEGSFTDISREQVNLLGDLDALFWLVFSDSTQEDIEDDPLYQQLDVATEGRDFFISVDDVLAASISFGTVLSLPFAIEGLVPILVAAIDGDPTTEATPAA